MSMGRLIITEQEKKDILNKYQDDTEPKILTYLRRHCPVSVIDNEFYKGMHYVLIDDRAHIVEKNKKYLVGKIYNFISEDFPDYDEKIVRRTIKKFLDLIITD
jgi:hypothetical protein